MVGRSYKLAVVILDGNSSILIGYRLYHINKAFKYFYTMFYTSNIPITNLPQKYVFLDKISTSVLQPGQVILIIRVNRVTFCAGQPGLTCFIKYPGLTWIWHRIMCVIIMTSHGDDVLNNVSISCQYISKRIIHC